jgi:hypothetical protein
MAKVKAADIISYISKYFARYGKRPTHSDIADKFKVSRSTISYHLGKEGGIPPTTVSAVMAQTPAKVEYLKLEPASSSAPTAEYLQAQKRLRLQHESQAGEVSANNEGSAPAPKTVPRFIVAIMMFIGAGCAVMSVINMAAFLIGSGCPVPLAIAIAVLTTLFSGTAFFLGSLCRKEKIPGGVLLYGLAVVIIGFSVFSSIAVVYENSRSLVSRGA